MWHVGKCGVNLPQPEFEAIRGFIKSGNYTTTESNAENVLNAHIEGKAIKKGAIEMAEKETELRTFRVKMFCDCGGEMKPTGMVLSSHPPQFPHQCSLCGMRATYDKSYPHLEYKVVESE